MEPHEQVQPDAVERIVDELDLRNAWEDIFRNDDRVHLGAQQFTKQNIIIESRADQFGLAVATLEVDYEIHEYQGCPDMPKVYAASLKARITIDVEHGSIDETTVLDIDEREDDCDRDYV